MTDFTNFSSTTTEQEGNFLALKFAHTEGATTTVEIVGGTKGPVTLDSDMNWVGRIESGDTAVKIVTAKGGMTLTETYSITGLILEPKSDPDGE